MIANTKSLTKTLIADDNNKAIEETKYNLLSDIITSIKYFTLNTA